MAGESAGVFSFCEFHARLGAIIFNYNYFASMKRAAAVVKADAYGVGVGPVARALHNSGVREFYCFTLAEACELRKLLGDDARIYFISGLLGGSDAVIACRYGLVPVLNRAVELDYWHSCAWEGGLKPLCIHIDSGFNRLGMSLSDWQFFCDFYRSRGDSYESPLLLSHLACGEEPSHIKNAEQLGIMRNLMGDISGSELSLSATGGAMLGASYHGDQLRIGIGLHGVAPGYDSSCLENPYFWGARVLAIRSVGAGETIGYGASPVSEATCVAILGCGYGDGLRRSFAASGRVFLGGDFCSVMGRVSMDCFAVDIGLSSGVCVGDMAEIIGVRQSLGAVAEAMGTNPNEVLCGIGGRAMREFIV